jgi:hypothetical protein
MYSSLSNITTLLPSPLSHPVKSDRLPQKNAFINLKPMATASTMINVIIKFNKT